ncbi:siderophore ABC transporter substrate-binding protein [Hyalangium versicolor]|uniref:siderophore ABC transporter substrate-binding protein n=1 Tax=Hyalangium versicolor TaxID=2861190 RepID=UPI001CC97ADE|nr:siderophore ABC transporter substrate-binding protein [Hyalangium versicolor]
MALGRSQKMILSVALLLGVTALFVAFAVLKPSPPETSPVEKAPPSERKAVRHSQGETLVAMRPSRVLVFDLAVLDILDALKVPVLGVANTVRPEHLTGYGDPRYLQVGTLFEPDYEAVNAARPDLILIGGRSSAKYASLSKIAPTVDLNVDPGHYLESVLENTTLLAGLFGKEAEAQALGDDVRKRAQALKAVAAGKGKGLIVMTTGGKMSAYGPGSRLGVIHDDLGVPASVESLTPSNHGESINAEFILKANPDWLFVVDRDAAIGEQGGARAILENELVKQTTAWSKGQVVYLDPRNIYLAGGGIQALTRLIEQLDDAYSKAR